MMIATGLVCFLLLDIICLLVFSEEGLGILGFLTFALFWFLLGCLIQNVSGHEVWKIVFENWKLIPVFCVLYLIIGVPWTFFKWWRFSLDARRKLLEWLASNPLPKDEKFPERHYYRAPKPVKYSHGKFSIQASDHKNRIITWLALWPFSMFVTVAGDLMIRVWEKVYETFSGFYQSISDLVFKTVEVDIENK